MSPIQPPPNFVAPFLQAQAQSGANQRTLAALAFQQQQAERARQERQQARGDALFNQGLALIGQGVPAKNVVNELRRMGLPIERAQLLEGVDKARRDREKQAQAAGQVPNLAALATGPQVPGSQAAFQGGVAQLQGALQGDERAAALNALGQGIALQRQQQESARLAGEAELGRDVAMEQFKAGLPGSTFERLLFQFVPEGQRADLAAQYLAAEISGEQEEIVVPTENGPVVIRRGRGGGQRAATPAQMGDLIEEAQQARGIRESVREIRASIAENRTRAGAAARFRNFVDSGVGLAEAVRDLTGSTMLIGLTQRGFEAMSELTPAQRRQLGVAPGALTGEKTAIAQLELEETLTAIALADLARRGGRAPSVQLIRQIKDDLNFKDIRGPDDVIAKLGTLDKLAARRERDVRERSKALGVELPPRLQGDLGGLARPAPADDPSRFRILDARPAR